MKKLAVLMAATGMAFIGVQGTANAAPAPSGGTSVMAWPTGCLAQKMGNSAGAHCTNGNGGSWRAGATCAPLDGGPLITRDAASWVKSGWSFVACPPLTTLIDVSYWSRSY